MPSPSALPMDALIARAQGMMRICNACRYCEGYCAVFPALERRLDFTEGDVHYLANLCHNCGSCLYACQYAPPHEFALNFPRTLAQVRRRTYAQYAWPQAFGRLYERNGLVVGVALAACIALLFIASALVAGGERLFQAHPDAQGSFYAVLPHNLMAGAFGAVALFLVAALVVSFSRFWPDMGEEVGEFVRAGSFSEALRDVFTLRYLDGGSGEGCTYPGERPSFARRTWHHFTFYGFLLCFAATSVATVYHYALGWPAPYPLTSLPVVLGIVGGIGLLVGPAGLLWLKARRDPELVDPDQAGMDNGFLVLLFVVSATGLALLFLRETRAMGVLLAVHLGAVLAFFLTVPYGKFVHALYRFAALVRFHVERRRALPEIGTE